MPRPTRLCTEADSEYKGTSTLDITRKGKYSLFTLPFVFTTRILLVLTIWKYILSSIARTFDQTTHANMMEEEFSSKYEGQSPFSEYNVQADTVDLLVRHSWVIYKQREEHIHLTRPGKDEDVSATYFTDKKIFFVFSTSTEFEA